MRDDDQTLRLTGADRRWKKPAEEIPSASELLKRFRNGDAAAFEDLVQANEQWALAIATKYTGDPHIAENAVQRAFVKVYMTEGSGTTATFDRTRSFRPWFGTIVIRQCTDILRAEHRSPTVSLSELLESEGEESRHLRDDSTSPYLDAVGAEIRDAISACTANLPAPQREVIDHYYVLGYTFEEIADIQKCAVSTVHYRHRVALKAIEKALRESGFHGEDYVEYKPTNP